MKLSERMLVDGNNLRLSERICATVTEPNVQLMRKEGERALRGGARLVEFRIDHLRNVSEREAIDGLSSYADRGVVTIRPRAQGGLFSGTEEELCRSIEKWLAIKPAYVDVDIALARNRPNTLNRIKAEGVGTIVSKHDFVSTASTRMLLQDAKEASSMGDIAKIVPTARSLKDNAKVLRLYKRVTNPRRLVAFCLGSVGQMSRVLCLSLGSPFTYAYVGRVRAASGQPSLNALKEVLESIERV